MEDVSHAHGALYRGRKVGTFGAVAAMSVMSGKALPAGEGGVHGDLGPRHVRARPRLGALLAWPA